MAVTYSRSYPTTDWTALGRTPLNGAPVPPPGGGQTITQLRDASLVLGAYRPDASTTGVDPTVTLTVTANHAPIGGTVANPTVYRNLDIRNTVQPVNIGNVRYENCIFRGPNVRPAGATGLYSLIRSHNRNFTFIDCTFKPQLPDYRWVGLHGYGWTARRCDMSRCVDMAQAFNPVAGLWTDGVTSLQDSPVDVVMEQCYLHDFAFFPPGVASTDPRWGGGEPTSNGSHSDGIQWQGGPGLICRGNYMTGMLDPEFQPNFYGTNNNNACLQIKPDVGRIANADISKNWFGGGAVTINIADAPTKNRVIFDFGNLSDNRFYRTQQYPPTNIILTSSTSQNPSGIGGTFLRNVRDDDNSAAVIGRGTQA